MSPSKNMKALCALVLVLMSLNPLVQSSAQTEAGEQEEGTAESRCTSLPAGKTDQELQCLDQVHRQLTEKNDKLFKKLNVLLTRTPSSQEDPAARSLLVVARNLVRGSRLVKTAYCSLESSSARFDSFADYNRRLCLIEEETQLSRRLEEIREIARKIIEK